MSPALALWIALGCAATPRGYSVEEFCALVESLGREFASGDLVILECADVGSLGACSDAGDGYLRTDEGTLKEAQRRCEQGVDRNIDAFYYSCQDSGGETISVQNVSCVPETTATW